MLDYEYELEYAWSNFYLLYYVQFSLERQKKNAIR